MPQKKGAGSTKRSLPAGRQVINCLSAIALATAEANRPDVTYYNIVSYPVTDKSFQLKN